MSSTVQLQAQVQKTSITDLPPELLSVIFKFAHESTTPVRLEKDIIPAWMRMEGPQGFQQSVTALVNPTIPEEPNLKSPALFPYSLAAVCSFWRDVLCSHSEFWTIIVLFVDSKPTSLVEASLYLKWSREQQIDVFITRRDGLRAAFHPDLHEKCQIDALLHILRPHLRRCRSLHVDAHLSSSFPIIQKTFDGIDAFSLEVMELVCDTHDLADSDDEDSDWDDDVDEFEPDLSRLVIDGKNFRLTSANLHNWVDKCMDLEQITIAHYQTPEDEDYCLENLLDSLEALTSLDQLKLESLHFARRPHIFPETFLTTPYVHLEDVSEIFIEDISKYVLFDPFSVLRITRCPLPDLRNFVPDTLILEDISSNVNLLSAITAWEGENLWLDRCHSFSKSVLKALARHRHRSSARYPCNEMHRLLLYRLPNFSIVSLKRMIDRRNDYVDYKLPDWKSTTDFGPAISHLAVVQCGFGKLSVKDEKWFRTRLVEFHWSSFSFSLYTYLR